MRAKGWLRRRHAAVVIQPMLHRHLDEVLDIENVVFPAPWSRALYQDELAAGTSRIYLVARARRHVIGYIGVMLVADEAHVTTIAVAEAYQGRGIGKVLMAHGLARAVCAGALAATLEVRVSNSGAQSLYHQFGFAPAGIRKNYYAEVNEDGLVMWSHDLGGPDFARRMEAIGAQLTERGLPVPNGFSSEANDRRMR